MPVSIIIGNFSAATTKQPDYILRATDNVLKFASLFNIQ